MNKDNNDQLSFDNKKNEIVRDKKSEISIDFLMIIGKYYKSNNDFINSMKLSKRYQDLTSMYHFNPISDTTLFENLQTQHFYEDQDLDNVLVDKFFYTNWTKKYFTNNTILDNSHKLVYEEDPNYENTDGQMVFEDRERPNDRYSNKRSLFSYDIATTFKNKLIIGTKLIITKEFSEIDNISGYLPIYSELTEIIIDDNVCFIPKRCFTDLKHLKMLRFPRRRMNLFTKTVLNCNELTTIYIPPEMIYTYNCFFMTKIREIILSKRFTTRDFYNFIDQLSIILTRESTCGSEYEDERIVHIKIIVRSPEISKVLFFNNAKNHIECELVLSERNIVEVFMNEMTIEFIFSDFVEPGYLDY